MEIKNAADQDRAYKAEFPELPMQWKNYGYEITEKLGEGISGSVYKLVKNKGEADEEISALKMISWTLNKKMVYREYGNDWVKVRRDFTQFFNDKVAHEVSRLESFAGAENIVQIKGSCLEKMPEENFWKLYIQMEYLEDFTEYLGKWLKFSFFATLRISSSGFYFSFINFRTFLGTGHNEDTFIRYSILRIDE